MMNDEENILARVDGDAQAPTDRIYRVTHRGTSLRQATDDPASTNAVDPVGLSGQEGATRV